MKTSPNIAMKISNARWTDDVNMLIIECICGKRFEHRADRWIVKCPYCFRQDHLQRMRLLEKE